jgi:hypothetical protein
MSTEEQQLIKQQSYSKAIGYMENAKETLKKAGTENRSHYIDRKCVKTACRTAYKGVLVALDAYLLLNGIKRTRGRKSIDYYCRQVGRIDEKMLRRVDDVYNILCLLICSYGSLKICNVKAGLDTAYEIINKIKPKQPSSLTYKNTISCQPKNNN